MCTSFVLHKEKTFIGMNFDISERPIKMALAGDKQLIILQKEGGRFLPALGLNQDGTFMNLQMVDPTDEGKYRRGKNCVHIMRLFDDVLSGKIETASLPAYLQEKEIVNVPDYSVHSLITAPDRKSYVVQPGRNLIELDKMKQEFLVLTNFSVSDQLSRKSVIAEGPGSDRYKRAYHEIGNHKNDFSAEKGISILRETAQTEGEYPTQLSMIFIPDDNSVYFTLYGDFNKSFKFSFNDKTIQTIAGFKENHSIVLSKKGILLSDLKVWQ